jgi:hypothetical protein
VNVPECAAFASKNMGSGQSSCQKVDDMLKKLAGSASVSYSDPFWTNLLDEAQPLMALPPSVIDARLRPYCQQLCEF